MKAYNCKSTSLLLVKGGSISSIGAGVLRPLSPSWEHNVRRIKDNVARSESASAGETRAFWRETGVSFLEMKSLLVDADCEDIFEVAGAF